jgi:RNAse (barnase) inhibitor barstar
MILFDSRHAPSHRAGEHDVQVPVRLEGKTALLQFLKDALNFPPHFGDNWDALLDCLRDVAAGADKFVLVHHDLPLESDPAQQRIYLEILRDTAGASDRLDAVFPDAFRPRISQVIDRP